MKTSLEKALQNKTKTNKSRDTELETEREPELTHLFKNNSFNISLYREFLYTTHAGFFLHILSWLPLLYLESIPHTSRAAFIFVWGVSLTHPTLALFLCGEFLLHILCWLFFFFLFLNLGSFSYRSRAGFVSMRGVSLTHPVLALFYFFI